MDRNDVTDDDFKASRGWLANFMKRNGLSLRRKTSVAQQDPERMIHKTRVICNSSKTSTEKAQIQFGATWYPKPLSTQSGKRLLP